jgi:diacylglycerol kinase family enzyme
MTKLTERSLKQAWARVKAQAALESDMTGELKQGQTDDYHHTVRNLEIGDLVIIAGGDGKVGEVVGIVQTGRVQRVHLRFHQYTDHESHMYDVDSDSLKRVGG